MKKIVDNLSAKEMLDQIRAFESLEALCRAVPFAERFLPGLSTAFDQFQEVKKQAEVLLVPDQFNEIFSSVGWIAYESMNLEIMVSAIDAAEQQGLPIAEQLLANYYDADTLKWGIMRFHGHSDFRRRIRLAELAKEDYLAERYHACIPLLLSLIDGLVNDVSRHVGFFAEGSDMTAWDCIAAHETGLMALAKVMRFGRNKTNEEQISIPFRNGILHGRDLAFDNQIVAAKCWAAMFAVRDWAGALAEGKSSPRKKDEVSWSELFKKISENTKMRKALDAWTPRQSSELSYLPHSGQPVLLPEGTPERAAAEFLHSWCHSRFGLMADAFLDFSECSKSKKAGRAKEEFGRTIPDSYCIVDVTDEASAISQVDADLHFLCDGCPKSFRVSIRMVHADDENGPVMRDIEVGTWRIVQHSFNAVIFDPTFWASTDSHD